MTLIYEGAISAEAMGGARLHFGGMARALEQSGVGDLEIVLPGFRGEQPFDPTVGPSARVRYVPTLRRALPGHLLYELTKIGLIAGLRLRDIARRQPTVHMMRISPIGLSPIVSRLLGAKVVVEVNGLPDAEFAARGFNRLLVGIVRSLVTAQLRAATHVVGVTDGLAEASGRRTNAPTMRLENAIDPAELRSRIERSHEGAQFTIAYSGAFAPWQELELLVQAFASLVDQYPDRPWKLILIGDGEDRAAIESTIERFGVGDRVELTGWVDRDESVERLLEARVAAVPLSIKGEDGKSPLKLFEYLAIGRTVVASAVDGIAELDGYPIIPYECGDVDSLASALDEATSRPNTNDLGELLPRLSWVDRAQRLLRFVGNDAS